MNRAIAQAAVFGGEDKTESEISRLFSNHNLN